MNSEIIPVQVGCSRHSLINPLQPNISMQMLYTALQTFPMALTLSSHEPSV